MFRTIVFTIIGFFLSYSSRVFGSNDDITKPDFVISLRNMDPLGEGQNIEGKGGIDVLTTLLGKLADLFLFMIPIIAAVSFLIAGYFYIFSAGDSEKTTKAKTIIKWNIIAITIALLSYGIIKLVAALLT